MRNIQALLFLSNASMKGICLRCILHASLAVQNCDHNDILIPLTRHIRAKLPCVAGSVLLFVYQSEAIST